MNSMRFGWMAAVLGLAMVGCGSDDDAEPLEIIGQYSDSFGGEQVITAGDWNGSAIKDFDNDKNAVYTQFPEDDEFSPNLFAKTVYTEPKGGSFYFCMVVFDAETLADAQASDATADDSDPGTTGCGGEFEWTLATKEE